jgi:hypothetical protein
MVNPQGLSYGQHTMAKQSLRSPDADQIWRDNSQACNVPIHWIILVCSVLIYELKGHQNTCYRPLGHDKSTRGRRGVAVSNHFKAGEVKMLDFTNRSESRVTASLNKTLSHYQQSSAVNHELEPRATGNWLSKFLEHFALGQFCPGPPCVQWCSRKAPSPVWAHFVVESIQTKL